MVLSDGAVRTGSDRSTICLSARYQRRLARARLGSRSRAKKRADLARVRRREIYGSTELDSHCGLITAEARHAGSTYKDSASRAASKPDELPNLPFFSQAPLEFWVWRVNRHPPFVLSVRMGISRRGCMRKNEAASLGDGGSTDGFRAPEACRVVGISYRQLDYWARTGLLEPSLQGAGGSGTLRLYSFTDLVELRVVKRLRDTGIGLAKIRKAIEWLRAERVAGRPWSDFTLLSDGKSIWASSNLDDTQRYLVDALRRGQGVFGIAVGQVRRDLEGETVELFPTKERSDPRLSSGDHELPTRWASSLS